MEKMAYSGFGEASKARWINLSTFLLVGILLLASFLRLYRIADYMTFLGDEGRDVLIVKHLLGGDWVGLGPTASVGGFFTGPIYYYFMAPFLWLFGYNPVGPAVMVALFGIATVFLVYYVGREFFGEKAGLIAAALYAISPIVIAYSRSSWNPNPVPFFSLLAIFVLAKAVERKAWKLFVFVGILLGIALQLHYIVVFLIVIIVAFMLITGFKHVGRLIRDYAFVFLGFLIGYLPFLAFEATHGFPNTVTVIKFIFGGTGETGFAGWQFASITSNVFFRLFGRLLTHFPPPEQITLGNESMQLTLLPSWPTISIPLGILYYATILLAIGCIALLFYPRRNKHSLILLTWLVLGISLFGFYKKPIYDYYLGFMFPLPFLLVGNLLEKLVSLGNSKGKLAAMIAAVIIFLVLVRVNLEGIPFRYGPNRQLAQVRQISEFVLEKAQGRPFNFALITSGNSDHGYRYFFELEGNSPVTIENFDKDPERQSVTDQLLVVCEEPNCKPLGASLWEVAGFGRSETVGGPWNVSVVKVYKLGHYNGIDR